MFNFLEDNFDDRPYEQIGASGEYRSLSEGESQEILSDWLNGATSEFIALPVSPQACVLALDFRHFKALVGSDDAGFFAVIQRSWEK